MAKASFNNLSALGIIKHKFDDSKLLLVEYNNYVVDLFGKKIIKALNSILNDDVLYKDYYKWYNLYKEVINDKKIHILTNCEYTNNIYHHYFVFFDVSGYIITIIYGLDSKYSHVWEEEILHQELISNIADSTCLIDTKQELVFFATSSGTYYGKKLDTLPKNLFKDKILARGDEVGRQVKSLFDKTGETFVKFTNKEIFVDESINYIRYFLSALKNQEGITEAILVRTKDITSRMENLELLADEKMKLSTILSSTAEGIFGVDLLGECTFTNEACLELLGLDNEEEIIGHNMHAYLHHHDAQGNLIHYKDSCIYSILKTGKPTKRVEKLVWRKDGTNFMSECHGSPLFNFGVLVGAIITFYNISPIKESLKALEESERSKSYLLSNIPGMAYRCLFDRDWTMLFVSEGAKELLGYDPDELLYNKKISYNQIIAPESRSFVWDRYNRILPKEGKFREEYKIITKAGEEKYVLELGRGVYNEQKEVIAIEGIIIDITEQRKRREEAEYLNKYDRLTGIYNRLYFEDLINETNITKNYPLTYIIGDINGLRLINDAYGKDYGNKHIVQAAKLIKEVIPKGAILARTGGDEFSLLLIKTTKDEAYEIYERIIENIKNYNLEKDSYYPELSVTFGFDTCENLKQDFSFTIKNAIDYMHRRKLFESNSTYSSILTSIKTTMYERSQETEEHAERLVNLTKELGIVQGLNPAELDLLSIFAVFHDIGKIGISDDILKKQGNLNEEEKLVMKEHPIIGQRICLSSKELAPIADLVLSHHERWDGTGYPQSLKGEEIPLLSRILAVVDAYDSMTNDRIYRPALSIDEALKEIEVNSGSQFDPKIAQDFINMIRKETQNVNKE